MVFGFWLHVFRFAVGKDAGYYDFCFGNDYFSAVHPVGPVYFAGGGFVPAVDGSAPAAADFGFVEDGFVHYHYGFDFASGDFALAVADSGPGFVLDAGHLFVWPAATGHLSFRQSAEPVFGV